MNNANTITALKELKAQLKNRLQEVDALDDDLSSVGIAERPRRRAQVAHRMNVLNADIRFVGEIIDDRELEAALGNAVEPLSETRKKKLLKALEKVSADISAVNTFKAAVKLARQISEAVRRAADASVV